MDDGTVVKTENATAEWEDLTNKGEYNDTAVHRTTVAGTLWTHETLYRSRKGRYWLEHGAYWEDSVPRAEWISNQRAAQWLLANKHNLPEDLQQLEEEVSE
jgi:hypothetical protein